MTKFERKYLLDKNRWSPKHRRYAKTCVQSGYLHTDLSNVYNYDNVFGGVFGYSPKYTDLRIKTLSVKDQGRESNCTIQAAVVQKEVEEGFIGSVRVNSCYEFQHNLCQAEGWSTLENAQKGLRDYGLVPVERLPEDNTLSWKEYTDFNSDNYKEEASKHRTKSYWIVKGRSNILKLLDQNKILTGALMWYSGYNRGSNLKNYYIIDGFSGLAVGGHSIPCVGYKYISGKLYYRFQNSYGQDWGDNGDLYILADFYDVHGFGFFANLDYDKSVAEILVTMEGKNVKSSNTKDRAIYLITGGYKIAYKDASAFVSINGYPYTSKNAFEVVDESILSQIETYSGALDGSSGKYADIVSRMKQPINENFNSEISVN